MMSVCEIFKSIQGESTRAGAVCAFVRLAGCNLDCSYCDTRYARAEGRPYSIDEIVSEVRRLSCPLVEVTGGEPLFQAETPSLCGRLLDEKYTVLVETNGSLDIAALPEGCIRIVDVKCPGSGEGESFFSGNLKALDKNDECKFVLTNREDFDWAIGFVRRHRLHDICTVLFSPAWGRVEPAALAAWIVECNAPVRLGLQMQKIIWGHGARGV